MLGILKCAFLILKPRDSLALEQFCVKEALGLAGVYELQQCQCSLGSWLHP